MTTLRKELRIKLYDVLCDNWDAVEAGLPLDHLAYNLADAVLEIAGIKSAEQRREEALQRKAEQRANKKDPVDFLLMQGEKERALIDMHTRIKSAFGFEPGPRHKELVEWLIRKDKQGETVELWRAWWDKENEYKRIALWKFDEKPDLLKSQWAGAFANKAQEEQVDTSTADELKSYYENYVPRERHAN